MLVIILNLTLIMCIYEKHESLVQSGWLSAVKHFVTDSGVTILTATAMYSQAYNKRKVNPWVAAQKNGSVICAHCDCVAG